MATDRHSPTGSPLEGSILLAAGPPDPARSPKFPLRGPVRSPARQTRLIFPKRAQKAFHLAGPDGCCRLVGAEVAILLHLCAFAPGTLRRWIEIAEAIWPDADRMPDARKESLDVRICRLRRKLAGIGPELAIITVWGQGYTMGAARQQAARAEKKPGPAEDPSKRDVGAIPGAIPGKTRAARSVRRASPVRAVRAVRDGADVGAPDRDGVYAATETCDG